MRTLFLFSALVFVNYFTTSILANPVPFLKEIRAQPSCANYPNVIAGTLVPRDLGDSIRHVDISRPPSSFESTTAATNEATDESSSLSVRASTTNPVVNWCIPRDSTYIRVTFTKVIAGTAVSTLLNEVWGIIDEVLEHMGDSTVPLNDEFFWGFDGVSLRTWETNGQKYTWSMLQTTFTALYDYMSKNSWGAASFTIYHGPTEVGKGTIG